MPQKKHNIFDDIVEGVRRILEEIERTIHPNKKKTPIPIPVRPERHLPQKYLRR